jgi:hypothetical protein
VTCIIIPGASLHAALHSGSHKLNTHKLNTTVSSVLTHLGQTLSIPQRSKMLKQSVTLLCCQLCKQRMSQVHLSCTGSVPECAEYASSQLTIEVQVALLLQPSSELSTL